MLLSGTCDLQQLLSRPEIAVHNAAYLQEVAAVYYESPAVGSELFSMCVLQGECATVSCSSSNVWIGSQDATTCVVAMLACPSSRIVWVAHLDSPHFGDRDVSGIEHALEQMEQPQLYLVGGYCDAAGQGPKLAQAFLQLLHSLAKPIHAALCCVAHVNTAADGAPRCCQLVLDTSTWTPHPWIFADRGPDLARRFAEKHCRGQATPIWDQQQQQMVLPPFDPSNIDSWQIMGYERLCAMTEKQMLQYCSTSPDHEPPWFPQDMRNMMQWLVAAQEADSHERMSAQVTHKYRYVGGSWQLVLEPAGAAAATGAAAEAATAAAVL